MAKFLRQSTASQEIVIGRMVDSTDGNTAETGLTIANTDIQIWKGGATTLANKNSGGATHISAGIYYAVLDATDTNTLGNLKAFVQVSGALAWEDSFVVLPAHIYDALVAGTEYLDGAVTRGTAQAATSTTVQLASGETFSDDSLIGMTIVVTGSTQGYPQTRLITDNVSSTDTVTVAAFNVTPSGTVTYKIYPTAPASGGSGATADEVVDELYSRVTTDPLDVNVVGWLGTAVDPLEDASEIADVLLSTNNADYDDTGTVGGNIAAGSVGGGLDAAGIRAAVGLSAADLGARLTVIDARIDTEIPAILNGVTAINAAVDTEVAAIKVKTDQMVFTKAGELDVNIQSMNNVTITGNGATGTEFGI